MKKFIGTCIFLVSCLMFATQVAQATPQCSGNNKDSSDPACWTSETVNCRWNTVGTIYRCNTGNVLCSDGYSNNNAQSCSSGRCDEYGGKGNLYGYFKRGFCGLWCTNNPEPGPKNIKTCHYIDRYDSWSKCVNNVQVGTNPHWTSKEGKNCRNVSATKACPDCVDKDFTIDSGLCTFNKGGCRPEATATVDVLYAGDYTIKVKTDRGNRVPPYECQGEEDFYMDINGSRTGVITDPEACEQSNTKHEQLVGTYTLKKGVNEIKMYHNHKAVDVTKRPSGGSQSLTIESLHLNLTNCPVAECGSAHKESYDKTVEFYDKSDGSPDNRCAIGNNVDNWDTSKLGLADSNGIAWTWSCKKDAAEVSCLAYKKGECVETPNGPPYTNGDNDKEQARNSACKAGSFNSVRLGVFNDAVTNTTKPVLTWKCGTGELPKTVGNFGSNSSSKISTIVPTPPPEGEGDYYGPKTGGVDCKCYPVYEFACVDVPLVSQCENNCGNNVTQHSLLVKKDTGCFPLEILTPTLMEKNNHPCPSKQVTCAACGTQAGEGSDIITEIN